MRFIGGNLKIVSNHGRPFILIEKSKDLFLMPKSPGGKIIFERDNEGKVIGFKEYRSKNDSWTFHAKSNNKS